MAIDVPKMHKWLEDVNEIDKHLVESFSHSAANSFQQTAYNAARELLRTLKTDLRMELSDR